MDRFLAFQSSFKFSKRFLFLLIPAFFIAANIALLKAQESKYHPLDFTKALVLTRGKIHPIAPGSKYLNKTEACEFLKEIDGWKKCENIDLFISPLSPEIDNLIVSSPNTSGYVKFDDWNDKDKSRAIEQIWNSFIEATKIQGEALGEKITPIKWYIYPTLNKSKAYMYYAILMNWNGTNVINVKASLFDRSGYIPFTFVPDKSDISQQELQRLLEITLSSYESNKNQSYSKFSNGDKIALGGALGVLATLVGVKFGKVAALGIAALALAILKKLWFLSFIPLVWFKKLFSRKTQK